MKEVQIKKAENGYIVHFWDVNSKNTYIFTNLESALANVCILFSGTNDPSKK